MADGVGVRLRQAVLVARELEPLASALREQLDLREPFRDPGVAEFGLANVVFALEDCFLEVVSPIREGTAGGRYLERNGDGGYMLIFDLLDLDGARERAAEMGIRVVWQIDLPDISGTHLHPADIGGAIVSIDSSRPYGSWRWGGPGWTAQGTAAEQGSSWSEGAQAGARVRLEGVTVAVREPGAVASRWAQVLGLHVGAAGAEPAIALDGGAVRFREAGDGPEGLCEIALAVPEHVRAGRAELALGGVRVTMRALDPEPSAAGA
ncbi:MAG TPA: hypothetical protein VFW29_10465 [Solirubrobacteraceae bacterium]|nr:hypothetical protein [Solirubrobacteraceae bacterium]